MASSKSRIVVLISGSGTNLQALIDSLNTPALPNSEIVLVLSNRKAAYGLTRAAQANPPIPTAYLALQPYLKQNSGKTREDYDAEVAKIVLRAKPDLVVLAGWMHILSEKFLELLDGRQRVVEEGIEAVSKPIPVINLHPALPGEFDGASAIERAYEAFQKGEITRSGAMVHRVVKDVDRGEPIVVREVPFVAGEAIEEFERRLHAVEHEIIVLAAAKVLAESRYLPSPSPPSIAHMDNPNLTASSFCEVQSVLEPLQLSLDDSDNAPFSKSFGSLFEALGIQPKRSMESLRPAAAESIDLSYNLENFTNVHLKDVNPEWSNEDIDEVVVMSKRRTSTLPTEDEPADSEKENSQRYSASLMDFSIEAYPDPRHHDAKTKLCVRRDTGKKYLIKCKRIIAGNTIWDEKKVLEKLSSSSPSFLPQLRWTFERKEYMYIVTDAYQNSLVDIIARYGSFTSRHALFYASELISALTFLHKTDIVHRDLSADNVMFDDAGHLVLTNLEHAGHLSAEASEMTYKQRVKEYTAPELLLGWNHGLTVDTWGFGIVLYYMYFGRYPFHSRYPFGDSPSLYSQIVEAAIPAQSLRFIHPLARELLTKCLERNPGVRWELEKVKKHPYFETVDWKEVTSKKIDVPYFIPLTAEIERQKISDPPKPHPVSSASVQRTSPSFSPKESIASISDLPTPSRRSRRDYVSRASVPSETNTDTSPHYRMSIPPPVIEEEEEPVSEQESTNHNAPNPAPITVIPEDSPEITMAARMSQVWATIDSEIISMPSVEFGERRAQPTVNHKVLSRPFKLRKHRSTTHARLFHLSTTSFHERFWKKPRSAGSLRPPVTTPPVLKPVEPIPNLPNGLHQIGSGIGFSYTLPEATPTQVSIASFVPLTCHGMFPTGFSVRQLGFGRSAATRRVKDKAAEKPMKEEDVVFDIASTDSEFSDSSAFRAGSGPPSSWARSASVPGTVSASDAAGTKGTSVVEAEAAEPVSPNTLVDGQEGESGTMSVPKDLSDEFPDVTLRLVPSSTALRQSFLDQEPRIDGLD